MNQNQSLMSEESNMLTNILYSHECNSHDISALLWNRFKNNFILAEIFCSSSSVTRFLQRKNDCETFNNSGQLKIPTPSLKGQRSRIRKCRRSLQLSLFLPVININNLQRKVTKNDMLCNLLNYFVTSGSTIVP